MARTYHVLGLLMLVAALVQPRPALAEVPSAERIFTAARLNPNGGQPIDELCERLRAQARQLARVLKGEACLLSDPAQASYRLGPAADAIDRAGREALDDLGRLRETARKLDANVPSGARPLWASVSTLLGVEVSFALLAPYITQHTSLGPGLLALMATAPAILGGSFAGGRLEAADAANARALAEGRALVNGCFGDVLRAEGISFGDACGPSELESLERTLRATLAGQTEATRVRVVSDSSAPLDCQGELAGWREPASQPAAAEVPVRARRMSAQEMGALCGASVTTPLPQAVDTFMASWQRTLSGQGPLTETNTPLAGQSPASLSTGAATSAASQGYGPGDLVPATAPVAPPPPAVAAPELVPAGI